jgi:hypothetical protein
MLGSLLIVVLAGGTTGATPATAAMAPAAILALAPASGPNVANPATMASSQVPDYTTTITLQAGTFWLSYELDTATKKLRVAFQVAPEKVDNGQGWASLGFSSDGKAHTSTVSQAVVFEGLGRPKMYRLGGQDSDMSVKAEANQKAYFSGDTSVEPTAVIGIPPSSRRLALSKRITYKFELQYNALQPGIFSDSGPTHILHAFNTGPLAWHTFPNKGSNSVNLVAGTANARVDNTADLFAKHGFLMLFGWGVCIPSGITYAQFFKSSGPYW